MRRWNSAILGLTASLSASLQVGACAPRPPESGKTDSGIYFEVEGRGPPVVLVHGFSLDRRMWASEVAALRSDHRVARYDLRGHGRSDPWTVPFSPVQDLVDVLDAIGFERSVIVGLSAGSELAIDFALEHPDRLSHMVLASPGLGGYQPVGSFEWMAPVMAELQSGNPEGAMRAWTETPLMTVRMSPVADSVTRNQVRENWRIWTYDPALQQRPAVPAIDRLSELDVPTLVVVGEEDFIDTRRVADTLAACLPDVEFVSLPGAGHLVNLEAPEWFVATVTGFLAREEGQPQAGTRPGC